MVDQTPPPAPADAAPSSPISGDTPASPRPAGFPEGPLVADENATQDESLGLDDNASSSASLTSSILKYRHENGRRYHAFKDGAYAFPNDDVEAERMDFQHMMFHKMYEGAPFLSPINLSTLTHVLDAGTGTGIWAVDLADDNPHAKVIGVDLSPIQPIFVPPNAEFYIEDLEDSWSFSKPFDLIFARMLTGSIGDWPKFYGQSFEHTVPEAAEKLGRPFNNAKAIKNGLAEAGFTDIVHHQFKWPTNRWPKDPNMKELGAWTFENVGRNLYGLSVALFTRGLGWSMEEFEVFLVQVRKEMSDPKIHGYFPISTRFHQRWDLLDQMLTIAEVSGLIAAASVIVQYMLPAALVIILIKYVGSQNNAVTWSVLNRTISTTLWPYLLRADAVSANHGSRSVRILSWTITLSAVLLVLASVLAPLGLYEEIVPSGSQQVQFAYAQDPSSWGKITMPRPDLPFTRVCESGLNINCPGQYQGVYMNETSEGVFQSVETDENSTINITIPANYTAMFYSATSDAGNTLSGMFDIQYRSWYLNKLDLYNKGETFAHGDFHFIENLIPQDTIHLKEGLVVDMRDTPGIGFRNHTVPVGLEHGGIWSEDLTWVEPVTQCVDTNLSVEVNFDKPIDSFTTNHTFFLVDEGAWLDMEMEELETRPWNDNQTLDLYGRAYKAARMHNVLAAASLNITLPLESAKPLPKIEVPEKWVSGNPPLFSYLDVDTVQVHQLSSLDGDTFNVFSLSNKSDVVVNHEEAYPDGIRKLLAMNYTAITNICRGYYLIGDSDLDRRGNNISFPAVDCGFVIGAASRVGGEEISADAYTGKKTYRRKLYTCATAMRVSIKTVDFHYNGTSTHLSNLRVDRITDKEYPNDASKPLWAVEHSGDKRMYFDSMWGLVNDSYETVEGFSTLRDSHLWLPTSPSMIGNFGETGGYDSLAAVSVFVRQVGSIYGGLADKRDYTGQYEYALLERFRRLSESATVASQIPSLIATDGISANLVGTKTAFSDRGAPWPASLAADAQAVGTPVGRVVPNKRVIRYDIRYAIPGLVILGIFAIALLWAAVILLFSSSLLSTLRNTYNQTSPGRLAASLLEPGSANPKRPTGQWVESDGRLFISFGHIEKSEGDYFCRVVENGLGLEPEKERLAGDSGTASDLNAHAIRS
ncbi:uncharacterized protein DNG_09905 [Cephalotrichum gorgonifer]|uniref:Methyltransferase domain-containing protein n=1 Tax=Cephalotrichum gorgonifer TaxID=2041049 RepID=A0AAE8N6K8_9PEZI|nr:uncharacterized protein DNG_09905 [Cephalotrichum gorgonifer]